MDQNPQTAYNPQVITQKEFNDTYWFTSLQMVTVTNPLDKDYPFMVEMRHFIIRAGETERFPGVIANVYLDQMSKILAQNDDKLSYMTDPSLLRIYYDKLIADVEDLVPKQHNPIPEYLRNVDPRAVVDAPTDVPPWENNMERARNIAPAPTAPDPTSQVTTPQVTDKPAKPEPGTKEFKLNGLDFSAVTDEAGNTEFFKNGKTISEADYAKAASMIE